MSIHMGGSTPAEFSCNMLQSRGKFGKLPTDDNGYREICVGAFDAYNDIGELYACTSNVMKLFGDNSDFNRRIENSYLRGEVGHPARRPGETAESFLNRALGIDLNNASHHIKKINLRPGKDENGRNVMLCIATLKPSGMKGEALEKMLANPDENVAFSIRCFTKLITLPDGREAKDINHPVTWDLVPEPGISIANKYASPSLESSKIIVTPELLDMAVSGGSSLHGFECASPLATAIIKSNLGWQRVQTIPTHSATHW